MSVGGRRFQTTRAALLRFPDSHIAAALLAHERGGSAEPLFVDGNGDRFQHILDFLCTGDLVALMEQCRHPTVLRSDARWYGLNAITTEIERRCNVCRFCGLSALDAPSDCERRLAYMHAVEGSIMVAYFNKADSPSHCTLVRCIDDVPPSPEWNCAHLARLGVFPSNTVLSPEQIAGMVERGRLAYDIISIGGDESLLPADVVVGRPSFHPNVFVHKDSILACIRCGSSGCTPHKQTCRAPHDWVAATKRSASTVAAPTGKTETKHRTLAFGPAAAINVGGELLHARLETLLRFPDSRVASAVSPHAKNLREGPPFVPGNAARFKLVLDYLRTLDVAAAMEATDSVTGLVSEAVLHGLPSLSAAIDGRSSRCLICGQVRSLAAGQCKLARAYTPHYQVGSVGLMWNKDDRDKCWVSMVEIMCNDGAHGKKDMGRQLAVVKEFPRGAAPSIARDNLVELSELAGVKLAALELAPAASATAYRTGSFHPRDLLYIIRCGLTGCLKDGSTCFGNHRWSTRHVHDLGWTPGPLF